MTGTVIQAIHCLLGIGVKGSIKSPYDDIIKKINDSKAYIYSIDVPSGVMEQKQELTVRADATITLQLMASPKLLILDEPCTGLDIMAREQLLQLIAKMAEQPKAPTLIYVTHHVEEILP